MRRVGYEPKDPLGTAASQGLITHRATLAFQQLFDGDGLDADLPGLHPELVVLGDQRLVALCAEYVRPCSMASFMVSDASSGVSILRTIMWLRIRTAYPTIVLAPEGVMLPNKADSFQMTLPIS